MALTQVSTGGIKDGQVQTADLADGQVTVGKLHADALDRTYTLGADGSNHYTFTGEGLTGAVNDPTLYLTRGKTYRFVNGNSSGAHPFRIQTTVNGSAGTEYNTGVTNNGGAGGSTIVFEVPHDAPDVLYYQCTSHGSMGGIFYITGALADGGVTTAKLADQAVTLAKLEHGTSSNDGKFLRANNGADPTFETVTGTTINNNANNRVITGSDTANTLEGEANLTYDGSKLQINDSSISQVVQSYGGNNRFKTLAGSNYLQMITQNDVSLQFRYATDTGSGTEVARVNTNGISFSSSNAASETLDDYEEGTWTPVPENLTNNPTFYNQQGKYVKIGSFVTIWGFIQLGSAATFTNDTQHLHIAGLPFAANDTTGYVAGVGPTTHQNFYWTGSTYNDYGANGPCFCGVANSTRTMFQVLADVNNGVRGTLRRKSLSVGPPILTWTISYRTTA